MLLEFTVGNYRSYGPPQTLSLVASTDRSLPEATLSTRGAGGPRVLRAVVLYGANGAGKTNLLEALRRLRDLVVDSARGQLGDRLPVEPFRFDEQRLQQPTTFELRCAAGEQLFSYGLEVDAERVHREWLLATRQRERLLFRREGSAVTFGASWPGDRQRLVRSLRPNALLLSHAAQQNHLEAGQALLWLRGLRGSRLPAWSPAAEAELARSLRQRPALRQALVDFAAATDMGIADFEPLPEPLQGVLVVRRNANGQAYRLPLAAESSGSWDLVQLGLAWEESQRLGGVTLLDEFDQHLHSVTSQMLLAGRRLAGVNGQWIVTTQDTALLDATQLRRDQIWFVEKGPDLGSRLCSLWDFGGARVRRDSNFGREYLLGRYGARPILNPWALQAGPVQHAEA